MPGNRVIAILSAGNLATTQSVTSQLREALGTGYAEDLHAARRSAVLGRTGAGDCL